MRSPPPPAPPASRPQLPPPAPTRPSLYQSTTPSLWRAPVARPSPGHVEQHRQPLPRRTPGLVNLGQTCYLNSVLQMLFSLPGFVGDVHGAASRFEVQLPDGSVLAALHRCFSAMAACPPGPLRAAPEDVHRALSNAPDGAKFRSLYRQQDAHDVLLHLLDRIAAEVAACEGGSSTSIQATWCPTRRSFSAATPAVLQCAGCAATSVVPECMRALSLELLPGDEPVGVTQKLADAFASEAGLERRCEACGHTRATHSRNLTALPAVLVLHIKRFTAMATSTGPMLRKVLRPVRADVQLDVAGLCAPHVRGPPLQAPQPDAEPDGLLSLDASSCDSQSQPGGGRENADTEYRLQAVVHHLGGSLASGHYTADAWGPEPAPGGAWLRYNDDQVSRISQGHALGMEREAYLLVYTLKRAGQAARAAASPAGAVLRERNE